MGISERKLRQQEEIRAKIIEQSWSIIEEEGWNALSIRRIADAIEYSVPVIYKHFENKEAIQEHFTKEGFIELTNCMRLAEMNSTDNTERIRMIANSYWEFAAQRTEHYRIMFGLGIPTCDTINSVAEMKQTSDIMFQAIQDLVNEQKKQQVDIYLKLKTFWSMLHGFISIELLSNRVIQSAPTPVFIDAIESFMFTLIYKK
ncbi:TetR/AcrR family transcriptional regulator [Sphingobacterium sp. LRF_L2]|uniref:TetR/AcrR family transcriptional regulator n=1 Tax=Sphingobacterium sp. LRF_L2 TaxID=3369421 RepID=UPI003F63429F